MVHQHLWADRDRVYLLSVGQGQSLEARAMIARIGPDRLVHHPDTLDDYEGKDQMMCGERADDSWPLLYTTIIDCEDCGAALQRQGGAVVVSPVLARSHNERFMAIRQLPHLE